MREGAFSKLGSQPWYILHDWMCKQGLYRLAEMVEHGFGYAVGSSILSLLQVPALVAANNVTLVLYLYSR